MDVKVAFGVLILISSLASSKDEVDKPLVLVTPPGGFCEMGFKEGNNVSNQYILTVNATSKHPIVYKLLNDPDNNGNHLVDIDEKSGRITFKEAAELDYEATMETENKVTIMFIAEEVREKDEKRQSVTGTVLIQIEDVNDEVPSFEADRRVANGFSIDNNTKQDSEIGRVRARDRDGTSPNNHISSYVIPDLNVPFTISSGGRIRVRHGYTINASEQALWTVTITAIDDGWPRLTGSTTTVIHVRSSSHSSAGAVKWCRQLMTSSLALIYVINLLR